MTDSLTVGLRERKRRETRERLECAAVEIASEAGLESVTIDAISVRADVSPRTFFNYFDSKEDAVLGLQFDEHTRQIVDGLVRTMRPMPLIDAVLKLLMVFVDDSLHSPELRDGRRKIMHEHPELLHRRFAQMNRMADELTESVRILMERAQDEHDDRGCADPCSTAQAQILLMACGTAVRAAMIALTHQQTELPPDQFTRLIHKKAAALVRQTIKKLHS